MAISWGGRRGGSAPLPKLPHPQGLLERWCPGRLRLQHRPSCSLVNVAGRMCNSDSGQGVGDGSSLPHMASAAAAAGLEDSLTGWLSHAAGEWSWLLVESSAGAEGQRPLLLVALYRICLGFSQSGGWVPKTKSPKTQEVACFLRPGLGNRHSCFWGPLCSIG